MSKLKKFIDRCKWIPFEKRSYEVSKLTDLLTRFLAVMKTAGHKIAGSGEGKTVLLHQAYEKATGKPLRDYLQMIGDCVSQGWGKGGDVRIAVESLDPDQQERHPGCEPATEWIYGASRMIQGRGQLRNDDGSIGAWAAAAVKENGLLFRKKYDFADLRKYSGKRAKDWGYRGFPYEYEKTADLHPVTDTALVQSWEEYRDAIANGYPVVICSDQGFDSKRDSQGVARARGQWMHCMVSHGMIDERKRPRGLIDNSWGPDWIDGPRPFDIPRGSFFAEAEVIDKMLRQGDSYAISGVSGFEKTKVDLDYSALDFKYGN